MIERSLMNDKRNKLSMFSAAFFDINMMAQHITFSKAIKPVKIQKKIY